MSLIRSRGNRATELRLIALMREHGITGWRRNAPRFRQARFRLPRERVAVFVDGCFWHRHPGCRFAYTPKSGTEFWSTKFNSNVARDKLVIHTLRRVGWKVDTHLGVRIGNQFDRPNRCQTEAGVRPASARLIPRQGSLTSPSAKQSHFRKLARECRRFHPATPPTDSKNLPFPKHTPSAPLNSPLNISTRAPSEIWLRVCRSITFDPA